MRNSASSKEPSVISTIVAVFCLIWCIAHLIVTIRRYLASKKIGPITTAPIIPFDFDNLKPFTSPEHQFRCLYKPYQSHRRYRKLNFIKDLAVRLKMDKSTVFPENPTVVSIKMDGFDYGNDIHGFKPIDGEAPGSYFTYQMFGDDRIQVTNYVMDEVSYVAGYCVYIPKSFFLPSTISYRREIIEKILRSHKYEFTRPEQAASHLLGTVPQEESTPLCDPDMNIIPTENWNVQLCRNLERDVMTTTIDGVVYHKEWSENLRKIQMYKCSVCKDCDLPPSYSTLSWV